MKKIKIIFIALLLILLEVNGVLSYEMQYTVNDLVKENIIEFKSIVIKQGKLNSLYPSIEIPENQTLNIAATSVGPILYIDTVLRINIDTHLLDANQYGKTLQTFILVTRPDYLFPFSLIGKFINYNKTFLLPENGTIELPFEFESTKDSDRFCITILAFTNFLGMYSAFHKLINCKSIFFECRYNTNDTNAPFTLCHLEGDEVE